MAQEGSYRIEKIASNLEGEINRLKAQVGLFWDKEVKHYIEFGLKDGLSIVELGSGPGFVTEKIIEKFSEVEVTAVEIDPVLVEYANKYLSRYQRQVRIIQGSIMNTGLRDNSFDFAITRLVLEHLPDPVNAVREVLRILKPGGKAIFVDNDFEIHIMAFPRVPSLRDLYDAYCQSRISEGGNPRIGRELPCILKKGGFTQVDFEVISAHSALIGEEAFLKSEGIGIPSQLVSDGFLSSKALGTISVEWRQMIKSAEHSIVRQLYMAYGKKPS